MEEHYGVLPLFEALCAISKQELRFSLMRISLLILLSLITAFGCKKEVTKDPPCISHSNLSLSVNDSLRITNCDTRFYLVTIGLDPDPMDNMVFSTNLYPQDTVYVHFDTTGGYTLRYDVLLGTFGGYPKQINVN